MALMAELPEASVAAIVTDPPYGLEFMGKDWDRLAPVDRARMNGERRDHGTARSGGYERAGVRYSIEGRTAQEWHEAWAREALRVLKPGGHLLAFGGTRTYHRLACAIEDAGFEIRDCLAWLYGSGFPKSLDVSKAIDRAAGAEREILRHRSYELRNDGGYSGGLNTTKPRSESAEITAPATPEAEQWQGWGTALKPAHEPIVLARKPLAGTVAQNVLEHGTGALNVDGCRIEHDEKSAAWVEKWSGHAGHPDESPTHGKGIGDVFGGSPSGRWPANVLLDEQAAEMLDEQTGTLTTHGGGDRRSVQRAVYGFHSGEYEDAQRPPDSGGASRFLYVAKSSSAERNAGLDGFEEREQPAAWGDIGPVEGNPRKVATGHVQRMRNVHPTVKPIELMRWLVRLVTPPGGTVLDPFTGSGTTGCAAVLEGFNFIGMEREAEYVKIAEARIQWWSKHPDGLEIVKGLEADRERRKLQDAGQLGMFS